MSKASISAHAMKALAQRVTEQITENDPFVMEDGVPKLKFDSIELTFIQDDAIARFKLNGYEVFSLRQPFRAQEGNTLHIVGLKGTMEVEVR